jgi:hypothetical protein
VIGPELRTVKAATKAALREAAGAAAEIREAA